MNLSPETLALGAGLVVIAAALFGILRTGANISLVVVLLLGSALLLSPKLKTVKIGADGGTIELIETSVDLSKQVAALAETLKQMAAQQSALAAQVAQIAARDGTARGSGELKIIQEKSSRLEGSLIDNLKQLQTITKAQERILDSQTHFYANQPRLTPDVKG